MSMTAAEWATRYPNFDYRKLACRCGKCGPESGLKMDPKFMDAMQAMRTELGQALVETSGFRCANHPEERKKATPGAHYFGKAMDVVIDGQKCHKILMLLSKYKFTGVGIGIRAGKNMLHLDMCTVADAPHFTARPNVWTY